MQTAISEISLKAVTGPTTEDAIKEVVSQMFWMWFQLNYNKKLLTITKWGFVNVTLRVRDLEQLFSLLFGPKPTGTLP